MPMSVATCVRMHACMCVCLSVHLNEAVTLPNTVTHCNILHYEPRVREAFVCETVSVPDVCVCRGKLWGGFDY